MSLESLENPQLVFWTAVTVIVVVVPAVAMTVARYWYRLRRAECDARLKGYMLGLGMSAEDTKTVIEAKSNRRDGTSSLGTSL